MEEEEELRTPPPPRHSQQVLLGVSDVSTSCLEVRRTRRMTVTLSSKLSTPVAALTQATW